MNTERVAQHLETEAAAGRFSGTVLLARGESPLFDGAYGLANRGDGVPVTASTRFGVASVGKAFTAVAIARLAERSALRFTTPVTELLPVPLRPAALSPQVTVHHLLTHTSGLADYFDEERLGAAAYDQTWTQYPTYRVRRPVDFLPLFAALPAPATPGERWAYCNAGYILLGLILEVITGRSYPEVVHGEVFVPAGMADAGFFPLDEPHPHVAVGYLPPATAAGRWTSNVYAVPPVGGPDGGAQCTARDLVRFLAALAGGTLLRPETFTALTTPHAALPDDGGDAYGYGVWLLRSDGPPRVVLEGEDPGFSARAFWYRDRGIQAVVLANISAAAGPIGRMITGLVADG